MIEIVIYKKAITSIGHAKYDVSGKDIYCAAISAILQSAMNWFKKQDIELQIKDGFFKMKLINITEENIFKLDLLKTQILAFNDKQYNKYIKITKERKDCYE